MPTLFMQYGLPAIATLLSGFFGYKGMSAQNEAQSKALSNQLGYNERKLKWIMKKWESEFGLAQQNFDLENTKFLENLALTKEQLAGAEKWKGKEFKLAQESAKYNSALAKQQLKQGELGLSEMSRQVKFGNDLRNILYGAFQNKVQMA